MMENVSLTERFENLSYAIGYYRKKKGFSQEQLAEKLGISRQHLAAAEAPGMQRGISLELLFRIAEALEIEPKGVDNAIQRIKNKIKKYLKNK